MSFSIEAEDINNEVELSNKLMDLAGIVFRKHYYASYGEKDDLISVGVLKALSLIKGGNFSENKGTLLNFLYTGMRNEMHNYLYHQKKKVKCEEMISEASNDNYFEDESFKININTVDEVCNNFSVYGDLKFDVCNELTKRGFSLVGSRIGEFIRNFEFNTTFKEDLIDRLCGAALWKSREYSP